MKERHSAVSFRAAGLIGGYLKGNLTNEEAAELQSWLNNNERNRQLFDELLSAEAVESQLQRFGTADSEAGWQRLMHKIEARSRRLPQQRSWLIWWRSIAAILILSFVGWKMFYAPADKPAGKAVLISRYGEDVLPGARKAQLMLSDGSIVALNGAGDSVFIENGSTLQRHANGSLVYTRGSGNAEPAWNTLRIPRGGEYMIVLGDGTRVWLNAASSLRYPVQFSGKERRVQLLEGEAYFEIANDNEKPFIVTADKMMVRALGTAFNVNTYSDADAGNSTTLAEGKVKVTLANSSQLLVPGQRLTVKDSIVQVKAADPDAITAWKNGLFAFNGAPLPQVMNDIARWYDVNIVYDGRFTEPKLFTGEIKRSVPVSRLLEMMELTGIANFRINGSTIRVEPYNK